MQQSKRRATTVPLKPRIARAVKKRAELNDQTVTEVVNQMLAQQLARDEQIIKSVRERQDEPTIPLDEVLRRVGLSDLVPG